LNLARIGESERLLFRVEDYIEKRHKHPFFDILLEAQVAPVHHLLHGLVSFCQNSKDGTRSHHDQRSGDGLAGNISQDNPQPFTSIVHDFDEIIEISATSQAGRERATIETPSIVGALSGSMLVWIS